MLGFLLALMGFNSHTLVERTRKRCTNFSCNDELTLTSPRQILYEKSYITICASWKVKPKFFKVVIWNPCQSSLFLTILVRLWFSIISLVFFYVSKILFSGFLQFKSNFMHGQNNSISSVIILDATVPFCFTVSIAVLVFLSMAQLLFWAHSSLQTSELCQDSYKTLRCSGIVWWCDLCFSSFWIVYTFLH